MSASTDEVSNADFSFLPEKSREKYLKAYELFNNWRLSKGAKNYSESVLLSYFMEISKIRLPSTLWSIYSMLKAVIKRKHDVNIETFQKLLTFLRKKSEGHKPIKSKIFTAPEIEKFLNEAPEHDYLGIKVVLIIGIYGACRCNELLNISVNDVEKHSDKLILVKLLNSKTKIERSLVIREEYVNFIDKYMKMRPSYAKTTRFFLQYYNGKCKVHPMGINKFSEIPRKIAIFLKLQEPHLYTGHCLRRTSLALLGDGDSGADLTSLKRHGDWKSSTDSEGRIEDSTESKSKIRIIETIYFQSPTDMSRPSTSEENFLESCPVSPEFEYPLQYTKLETELSPNMTQGNNMSEENFMENCPVSPDPPQYTNIKTEPLPNMTQGNNMSEENFMENGPVSPDPPQYTNIKTEPLPNMKQVNNMTISVPDQTVTFNLTNCSNLTFNLNIKF